MIEIDTCDRSKSQDESMIIILLQWKTVNDSKNTQKHLQFLCTNDAEYQ